MYPTTCPTRSHLRCFALATALLISGLTFAQTVPAATAASVTDPATGAPRQALEQRTERIHVEDSSMAIDEVRIGGETKSIDVKPKGGMPAYQVAPTTGERSWKVLGF